MKNGIICLGEALIDFIPLDSDNLVYQKSPGGAPANVAVGLARLGLDVMFLGKVGQDGLGRFLKKTLDSFGVDISTMSMSSRVKTGVVFVTLEEKGERSFEFFIHPSADSFLEEKDVDPWLFKTKKILHIGSISLIHEPSQSATRKAIKLAKENEMLLSYDPNLRLSLWKNEEVAKTTLESVLPDTDLLKLSEEELIFLTGNDGEAEMEQLAKRYDIPFIFVTKGEHGSLCYCHDGFVHVPAMNVDAVDTTGAGDAFVSAILYQIHQRKDPIETITQDELIEMARFASVSGGMTAAAKGAMSALPTLEAIQHDLQRLCQEGESFHE